LERQTEEDRHALRDLEGILGEAAQLQIDDLDKRPLTEICREVISVAHDIKFELMGIGNSVDLKKDLSEILQELRPVEEEVSKLKLLRPKYDAAAFEAVGAELETPGR
jgi:hypothetical protein